MYRSPNLAIQNSHGRDIVFDYRYKANNSEQPLILFCHGFKGFKDWGHFNLIADYFAEQGFIFAKLNYSFNGTTIDHPQDFVDLEAFGNNNFSKEIEDIKLTLKHLLDRTDLPVDTDQIHLIGHSKGGASSIIASNEVAEISSSVLWAPVLDISKRYASHELEAWEKAGVIYVANSRTNQEMPLYYQLAKDVLEQGERFDIPTILKRSDKPTLILHGEADETLKIEDSIPILEAANNDLIHFKAISDADHVFGGTHPFEDSELPQHSALVCQLTANFFSN